jgi:hypothetical protein
MFYFLLLSGDKGYSGVLYNIAIIILPTANSITLQIANPTISLCITPESLSYKTTLCGRNHNKPAREPNLNTLEILFLFRIALGNKYRTMIPKSRRPKKVVRIISFVRFADDPVLTPISTKIEIKPAMLKINANAIIRNINVFLFMINHN